MNKVKIAFPVYSKQTMSSKCHNHMETLRGQEYRCGIARAEFPGNSSLTHWCLLLSTGATFSRPSMTANLFSLNLSSVLTKLELAPGGFCLLGMDSGMQVDKIVSVDDDAMGAEVWQCSHSSVGCPIVAVDFCIWPNASLNNWQQSCCIPSIYYLKITSRRIVVARHYSKYPRISCCSPSPTILLKKKFSVL